MIARFHFINGEKYMMDLLQQKKVTQKEIARHYAHLIRLSVNESDINYPRINAAIIDRWSMAGLNRIKNKAWKIAEGTRENE